MFCPSAAMDIRTERRCDYMLAQMKEVSAQTHILEIGCGTGELSALIASKTTAQVTGSDISSVKNDFTVCFYFGKK
jgi:cyclopropane fatty-acyl-phospholipid synthase-like methyltransferase